MSTPSTSPSTMKAESPPVFPKNRAKTNIPPHQWGPQPDEFQLKGSPSVKKANEGFDWKGNYWYQKGLREKYPYLADEPPWVLANVKALQERYAAAEDKEDIFNGSKRIKMHDLGPFLVILREKFLGRKRSISQYMVVPLDINMAYPFSKWKALDEDLSYHGKGRYVATLPEKKIDIDELVEKHKLKVKLSGSSYTFQERVRSVINTEEQLAEDLNEDLERRATRPMAPPPSRNTSGSSKSKVTVLDSTSDEEMADASDSDTAQVPTSSGRRCSTRMSVARGSRIGGDPYSSAGGSRPSRALWAFGTPLTAASFDNNGEGSSSMRSKIKSMIPNSDGERYKPLSVKSKHADWGGNVEEAEENEDDENTEVDEDSEDDADGEDVEGEGGEDDEDEDDEEDEDDADFFCLGCNWPTHDCHCGVANWQGGEDAKDEDWKPNRQSRRA